MFIDKDNNTSAMIEAKKGNIPEDKLNHDSSLKNKQGYTVAMYLA